jgi:hypothetical protein
MRRIVALEEGGGFRLNLDYFRHHREKIDYEWDDGAPTVGTLYSAALTDLLGPPRESGEPLRQRHKDLARSVRDVRGKRSSICSMRCASAMRSMPSRLRAAVATTRWPTARSR